MSSSTAISKKNTASTTGIPDLEKGLLVHGSALASFYGLVSNVLG